MQGWRLYLMVEWRRLGLRASHSSVEAVLSAESMETADIAALARNVVRSRLQA
jgi:hypothetical protein